MPRFGSIFNKINEKLEEAKISDLNHELGKWVQGSNAYLGSFKSGAITVGSKLKTESKGIWRTGGFGSSSSKPSGIPKSLSLPAFPSGPSQSSASGIFDRSENSSDETRAIGKAGSRSSSSGHQRGSKYLYKSSNETDRSFFDDIDEAILKGNLSNTEENEELGAKSEIVEKFIKVVESSEHSRYSENHLHNETASGGKSSRSNPFGQAELQKPLNSREEIRKKLAFGGLGNDTSSFGENNSKKQGLQRKGGDLEVCYINETILEEEQSDEEEPEDSGTDQLNLEEENELYDDYHYEEDFWDHIKASKDGRENPFSSDNHTSASKLKRSQTDWEGFKVEKDTISSSSESYKEESNNPDNSLGHLQSEAALALGNCYKIARRKFLQQKEEQRNNEVNSLKQLIGRSAFEKIFVGSSFNPKSLTSLNTPTIQVIVNDFHCKIEKLNEELVHLVIEKDELQIEQDSQLLDLHDFQSNLSPQLNIRA